MRVEDVEQWYRQAGYRTQARPMLGEPNDRFRPDLLVERGAERRAVRVSPDALDSSDVRQFGIACVKHDLVATIVAPLGKDAQEAARGVGVEHIDPERALKREFLSRFRPAPEGSDVVSQAFPALRGHQDASVPVVVASEPTFASIFRKWWVVVLAWALVVTVIVLLTVGR